jgi:hypothetical protein
MQQLTLDGHYGRSVDIDVCPGCHLLWFDNFETVNITGRGVLHLLRAIDAAHGSAHTPLGASIDCPRCGDALRQVHNLTTVGKTAHHECPHGHGAAQSFSLYLGEKGFVRPLLRPEIEQLKTRPEDRHLFTCINCGAPIDPRERDACGYCASPVRVLDVLPLMRAVDRQTGQLGDGPATGSAAGQHSFACQHCGASLDPAFDRSCPSCAMPVAITDLKWAMAWIEKLAPAVERGRMDDGFRERRLAAVELQDPSRRAPVPQPRTQFRMPFGYEVYMGVAMGIFFLIAWWYSG